MDIKERRWVLDAFEQRVAADSELNPLGYSSARTFEEENRGGRAQKVATEELKMKKVWELANSPAKTILMTVFMFWMAGSSVNIFTIMLTLYTFLGRAKSIFSTNTVFAKYDDLDSTELILPKLTFIALNMVDLLIALYKANQLGLLPSIDSDFLSFLSSAKEPFTPLISSCIVVQ